MYVIYGKRILDICVALVLLIVSLPITFSAALLIVFNMGRPIWFCQTRPGQNKTQFIIIKFRTMNAKRKSTELDEERITLIGKLIRKFSVDELPQLINVLKGDMSLVGPRPLLTEYNDLFSDQQLKRFVVKPGITGWAQVNGRNQLSWEEKLQLDVFYVNNISLALDVKILLKTIWVVLGSVGFKPSGEEEKFSGNNG
ncbi:sugar transferase [Pseudopelagicola sp. nBUS_20]|uniref:sugar transferase n=1 Tax=Pseudopelagicola sp. nBUS_20 TaxID=3395317 RepID=UPI003EBF4FEA